MSKNIVKNTLYYTIGEIVPRILSFLLLPILTLYLTANEYGMNSYITAVMSFVLVVASLSLNTFLLRSYYHIKDERERKEVTGSIFLFILFFNVILVGLQILIFPLIISYFNIAVPFYPYFLLAILINFFEAVSIIPLILYRIKEDAKGFLMISLSKTILQFILVYIFVITFRQGLEGSLYSRLLVNIPFFFIYLLIIKRNGIFILNGKFIKQALRFSVPLLPGALSFLFISFSDRIILERYITLDQIGIFSVAATLSLVLNVIIQALYKSFEPIIFKEFTEDNFQDTNIKLFRIYLFALFVGAFCTSIFSKEFFVIATSGVFREAYRIVPFLIISVVISGINTYYGILLIANKKTIQVSSIYILAAIINIVLNFVFVPYYGYYGAIIASTISFLAANLAFQYNIIINNRYLIAQVVLIIFVVVIPVLYDSYLDSTIIVSLVFKAILCVIYCIISFLMLGINIQSVKEQFFHKGT
jgi:O-antigen/teichoic acid export membrane protein